METLKQLSRGIASDCLMLNVAKRVNDDNENNDSVQTWKLATQQISENAYETEKIDVNSSVAQEFGIVPDITKNKKKTT